MKINFEAGFSAFFICIFISINSYSQSLSPERVAKIKNCTVKITLEDGVSVGSGFLINGTGVIATCWHVVSQVAKLDQNNKFIGYRKITVQFNNGTTAEYGVPLVFLKKSPKQLLAYDICVITPNAPLKHETDYLKIGNYSDVQEGDEVITCGYPLSLTHPFISRGIISTKFVDTSITNINSVIEKKPINLALMDITLNKGNSGGAIVKIGNNISSDEVIGIADFIVTPVGKDITELQNDLRQANSSGGFVQIAGVNPNASLFQITNVLTNISNGISGCVSIGYLQVLFDSAK